MIEKIAVEIGGLDNDRCNPCTEKKIIKCKDCLDAAKRVLTALLEPPEEMRKFEIDNDLFDWDCNCNYCGGHKFAYQAVIKKALLDK